jgi:hypothetical protein
VKGPAKSAAEVCSEHHGLSNPLMLVIACKCSGCDGELHCDGINATGALGFLICTACRCVYTIGATKEIRR